MTNDELLGTSRAKDMSLARSVALVRLKDRGARCCDGDISGPRCRQKRIFGQGFILYKILDLVNLKYEKALKFHYVVLASQTGRADRKKNKNKINKNEKVAIQAHDVARSPSFESNNLSGLV